MMKLTILCLSIVAMLSIEARSQQIDVILIGGQSNATGQAYVSNIPRSFDVDTTVLFFHSQYLNSGNKPLTWRPLCQASETPDKFGVELSLGTALKKKFPNRSIVLIKHGLSGSNLYSQWNPGNRNGEPRGAEYEKFVTTVKLGLEELIKQGYKPVIRAMVWQQGEADARYDAGMRNSENYASNLKNLILQLRKDLDCEQMQFVYGRVLPLDCERFTGRLTVRKGLGDVAEAAKTQFSVKGATIVECDDLQMRFNDYNTPMPDDDVHLGTFGILTLGDRFASQITF